MPAQLREITTHGCERASACGTTDPTTGHCLLLCNTRSARSGSAAARAGAGSARCCVHDGHGCDRCDGAGSVFVGEARIGEAEIQVRRSFDGQLLRAVV